MTIEERADLLPGKIVNGGIGYWLTIEKSNHWIALYESRFFDDEGENECLYLVEDLKLSGVIEKMINALKEGK